MRLEVLPNGLNRYFLRVPNTYLPIAYHMGLFGNKDDNIHCNKPCHLDRCSNGQIGCNDIGCDMYHYNK